MQRRQSEVFLVALGSITCFVWKNPSSAPVNRDPRVPPEARPGSVSSCHSWQTFRVSVTLWNLPGWELYGAGIRDSCGAGLVLTWRCVSQRQSKRVLAVREANRLAWLVITGSRELFSTIVLHRRIQMPSKKL